MGVEKGKPFVSEDVADGPHRLAQAIIERAEFDVVYEPRFIGESSYLLRRHFQDFIRKQLEHLSVSVDDNPIVYRFVDTHARELADFVTTGLALNQQIRLPDLEMLGPDPEKIRRVDLWDGLASHIRDAERSFISNVPELYKELTRLDQELQSSDRSRS